MENKFVFGILINLVVWPIIIYWLFKNYRINKQISEQQHTYNNPDNKFKREISKLNLNLSLFSNRGNYPYVLEPSFTNRFTPKEAIGKENPDYYKFTNDNKIKVGRSESDFYKSLCLRFGSDKILFGNFTLVGYFPDFIYIDKINNIFIDIEIDEPYSLEENKPIHYFQIITDEKGKKMIEDQNKDRDSTFLKYGWTVIRFSEEQILSSIELCIDIVSHVVNYWSVKPSTYNFENSKINIQKRWTKEDAIKMAIDKYRMENIEVLKKMNFNIDSYLRDFENNSESGN